MSDKFLFNSIKEKELSEKATTEDYSVVGKEGARQISRKIKYYNLQAKIKSYAQYDKFRVLQDKSYRSDFDKVIKQIKAKNEQ